MDGERLPQHQEISKLFDLHLSDDYFMQHIFRNKGCLYYFCVFERYACRQLELAAGKGYKSAKGSPNPFGRVDSLVNRCS